MKVMFINPPYTNYGGVEGHGGKAPPLNIGYLMSYIQAKGFTDIEFLDAEALGLDYGEIKLKIKASNPDVLCMTMPTPAYMHVLQIAKIAKEANEKIITVVGGPHPTALPEDTVKSKSIDFAIIGEGEKTLHELLLAIKEKKGFSKVRGIAYKDEGKVFLTGKQPLIENLDEIPFPARELMPLHLYCPSPTKRLSDKKPTGIIGGRGCPYRCTFCPSAIIWGNGVRVRSIGNLIEEMEECVNKFDLREFNFHDETFTLYPDRVIEICREIINRKLDVVWMCMGRVDTISRDINKSKEMLKLMKDAGCKRISLGLESGNQKVLNSIKKGATLEQAEKAVKLIKDAGIEIHASFMLGNIGETKDTINDTIRFAKKLDIDVAAFFIATPYPGTEMYDIALKEGLIEKNIPWEYYAPISKKEPAIKLNSISREEVINLQKKAYNSFYLRPKYIIKRIRKLKDPCERKIFLEGIKIFFRLK